MTVKIKGYLSPTLVLLAMDWDQGKSRPDFLGFAIKRVPGFRSVDGRTQQSESWLPNRVSFNGPVQDDIDSNKAPIQKFMWWDARIDEPDRGATFRYTAYPVVGKSQNPVTLDDEATTVSVTLPHHVTNGIGTWFNRAVLSSQAFSRKLKDMELAPNRKPPADKALVLREWLANDLEKSFGEILRGASRAVSAVYHLTDSNWVIPGFVAFANTKGANSLAVVYDSHVIPAVKAREAKDGKPARKAVPEKPSPNQSGVNRYHKLIQFFPRDKTGIMHHKYIVSDSPSAVQTPTRVMMGSANFTTEGITQQANVLHVFDSPELAKLYEARALALASNPTRPATAKLTPGWSKTITVGTAEVRLSLSPESSKMTTQIDTIVKAIGEAKHSVLFCIFTPTDERLRKACFKAAADGLMMFGIVNNVSEEGARKTQTIQASGTRPTAPALANMELYHRSQEERDVIEAQYFSSKTVPAGFEPEYRNFPGETGPDYAPVIIHHKFVIIDGESESPIIYSGSANMSENSEHNNDENLLEIKDGALARTYVAEFMRLYEHYRARAIYIDDKKHPERLKPRLILTPDRAWSEKYYKTGSPEERARIAMASFQQ
ncbi:phospholipase D-like domain-containing protein [Paraburkholderia sp. RL18-101-BIB-B]|uniref:phospholipase D-like domain-containing protein n=1 Tax=Paraburkholderia sp. RL18-101-BIB-B TaxID=3031634 RepID=UPI0038B93A31